MTVWSWRLLMNVRSEMCVCWFTSLSHTHTCNTQDFVIDEWQLVEVWMCMWCCVCVCVCVCGVARCTCTLAAWSTSLITHAAGPYQWCWSGLRDCPVFAISLFFCTVFFDIIQSTFVYSVCLVVCAKIAKLFHSNALTRPSLLWHCCQVEH